MEFDQNKGGRLCKQEINETGEKKNCLSSPKGTKASRVKNRATEKQSSRYNCKNNLSEGLTVLTEKEVGEWQITLKKQKQKRDHILGPWP